MFVEFEYYNFENLINQGDLSNIKKDVDDLIQSGQYWKNSPKYQTDINVFGFAKEHWTKMKMSFIMSCFMFLKQEVQIKNIQSWSFKTKLSTAEDRDILWHHHNHDKTVKSVSGIFYVDSPFWDKECGTEFCPVEIDKDNFFAEPRQYHWLIYPSSYWHRPGILKNDTPRYVVAADMQF